MNTSGLRVALAVILLTAGAMASASPVEATTTEPTYCGFMADSTSSKPRHFWLYVNCDTPSPRYTVKVVVRGPNDFRRVLYRGTPEQGEAFIDRWIKVPSMGLYTIVIRDYDPGTSTIPEHRGLDRFQIRVY